MIRHEVSGILLISLHCADTEVDVASRNPHFQPTPVLSGVCSAQIDRRR